MIYLGTSESPHRHQSTKASDHGRPKTAVASPVDVDLSRQLAEHRQRRLADKFLLDRKSGPSLVPFQETVPRASRDGLPA
jgi:hypothetical protein